MRNALNRGGRFQLVAGCSIGLIATGMAVGFQSVPNPSVCCFTQTCTIPGGSQSVTDCLPWRCADTHVCSGDGGCNPIWAQAKCIPIPVGD